MDRLVNLLDPQYREPVLSARQRRARRLGGLAVFLIIVTVVFTAGRYLSLVQQLDRTQEKLAGLGISAAELEKMRREMEQLDAETAALYQVVENSFSASALLKDLHNNLPGDTYLAGIRLDPGGILLISGGSENLEMAGIYLNRIARLPYLKDAVLLSVNQDAAGAGQKFQIRATVRALAAAAENAAEGGEPGVQ